MKLVTEFLKMALLKADEIYMQSQGKEPLALALHTYSLSGQLCGKLITQLRTECAIATMCLVMMMWSGNESA